MNEAYAYGMITPSTVHVLTFGGDGLWYARRGGERRTRQPLEQVLEDEQDSGSHGDEPDEVA